MKKIILVFYIAIIAMKADAAITIMGSRSCGKWFSNKNDSMLNVAQNTWLTAFLSGIAYETYIDFLRDPDPESLILWMDNYCRDNPLSNTSNGGYKLAQELIKKYK